MKSMDIKAEATRIAAEHIADGWTLGWDDTSRGSRGEWFLCQGDRVRRLAVREESGFGSELDRLTLTLTELEDWWSGTYSGYGWRAEDERGLLTRDFWMVDDDWFTTDRAEAAEILAKRRRRMALRGDSRLEEREFEPSAGLIEALLKRPGFEGATAKNVRVTRRTRQFIFREPLRGYSVKLLNRAGNVKAKRFFPLG